MGTCAVAELQSRMTRMHACGHVAHTAMVPGTRPQREPEGA